MQQCHWPANGRPEAAPESTRASSGRQNSERGFQAEGVASASRNVAISFLRLANLDSDIGGRLSRYEAALWRQLAQALFTLQALKRR